MSNYLILGGSGFIGLKIVEKLCKNNNVIVGDIIESPKISQLQNVSFVYIDFVNTTDFTPYLQKIDTVIHLVSTVLPSEGTENLNCEIRENVFSTINLLDSMVNAGVKKLIFISSGGTVYGEGDKKQTNEGFEKHPISKYGVHKLVIEKYIHLYYKFHNIDYRVIRLSNPYGSLEKINKKQGIIPVIIDNIISKNTIHIWGDGENIRDYIHIDDAIEAFFAVDRYDGEYKIFNVGTGKGYTLNQIISIIIKELNCEMPTIKFEEARKCDVRKNILDISLLNKCTGWRPQIELEDGIKRYIKEITNHE